MNKEVRYSPIVFRNLEEDSRRLEGRAIVFDSYSNNLGFYEKINRSAVTQELINNSDIIFTFNHDPNQLLARFRNGGGSLDVELREDGVYFSFDIPNTTLGNDIYELIKRGDISNCSFCFSISDEKDSQKWEKREGKMYREIMKIGGLYDLSAVTYPAYSDTDINARSIEARNIAEAELDKILKEAEEKMKEEQEKEQEKEQENRSEEVEKPEEKEVENLDEKPEAENREEEKPEEVEKPEEKVEKPVEEKAEKREINKENKNNINIMNKQNSLVKELRNAIENNQKSITVNAETRTVTVQGYGTGESAVDGVHDEVVETEIQGILEPLYANSVLANLGVRWYSGLPKGDVQVPIMGKGSCGWAGEIEAASASGNTFTTKRLSPKRLTAYVDISKQLLAQDTIGVEAAIKRDIVNALNDKLEATIFGAVAGDTEKPAGIFYGATEDNIDTYAQLCAFEAKLDDANVNGQKKYLMGNTAKATFRSMIKGNNNSGFILENGQIDGTPMVNTSNVSTKKFVYGDFNYLAVGSWGDVEIVIDNYTQAINGCVRLIINAYFDAVVLRPEAFKFGNVD
jgi:HK97 family phage major capsid protein/HK97 family phage prohead protease